MKKLYLVPVEVEVQTMTTFGEVDGRGSGPLIVPVWANCEIEAEKIAENHFTKSDASKDYVRCSVGSAQEALGAMDAVECTISKCYCAK